jgi:hypothetical protein
MNVIITLVFIFIRQSGDSYKNMIKSDNFYGPESGSVGGTKETGTDSN